MTNLDRYRADRDALVALGEKMLEDFVSSDRKDFGTFEEEYQCWYTEASAVVRQLIPDRLAEFEQMYKGEGKGSERRLMAVPIRFRTGSTASEPARTYSPIRRTMMTMVSLLCASTRSSRY